MARTLDLMKLAAQKLLIACKFASRICKTLTTFNLVTPGFLALTGLSSTVVLLRCPVRIPGIGIIGSLTIGVVVTYAAGQDWYSK